MHSATTNPRSIHDANIDHASLACPSLDRVNLDRAHRLREAALLLFCEPTPEQCARLNQVSRKEWDHLLQWLDTSGLALYFFDRLKELGHIEMLPAAVRLRLEQNLKDNADRIAAMIAESVAIQTRFQQAELSYAVLKGFSLWPISVPKLESRSQLDLDFLVSEDSSPKARQILEDIGYRLRASDGKNFDFKADEKHVYSLKDIYKAGMGRAAELHIEHVMRGQTSLLTRTQHVPFHGISMPLLPPTDLFLGQGLHLYKHVCSQFARTAHLIEFRRHIIARYDDHIFWSQLQQQVSGERSACMRLGLVIHLTTRVMGRFAPPALTCWTVGQLPATVRLWVDMYGHRTVLAGFPGNKLYLLLEKEMELAGVAARRSLLQSLVPRRLPPAITHPVVGETFRSRMKRHRKQFLYSLFRLRFSAFEGSRLIRELFRWQQYRNGLAK